MSDINKENNNLTEISSDKDDNNKYSRKLLTKKLIKEIEKDGPNLDIIKTLVEQRALIKENDNLTEISSDEDDDEISNVEYSRELSEELFKEIEKDEPNLDVIKALVEKGATINNNYYPNSAIHLLFDRDVLPSNFKLIFNYLIKKGMDINDINEDCNTALHLLCMRNNLNGIKFLIKKGANTEIINDKCFTPLFEACFNHNFELVKYFIKIGAKLDYNDKDENEFSAIEAVCIKKDTLNIRLKILKYLVKRDINYIKNLESALYLLLNNNRNVTNIVRYIIKQNINININNYGMTALACACTHEHTNVVKLLIEAGANINIIENFNPYYSILHILCNYAININNSVKIIEILIKAGAELNIKDYNGNTPLHIASRSGYKELVEILIKSGADVNIKNNKGQTYQFINN